MTLARFRPGGRSPYGLAGLALMAAVAACAADGGLGADRTRLSGQGTPAPGASGSSGVPGTSASGLSGGVGEGSPQPGSGASPGASASPQAPAGVLNVTITPQSAYLNVPAAAGLTAPSLKTSQAFTARVDLVGGGSNQQVTWSSSNPGAVAVSSGGLVTVAAGAATGSYEVRATSTRDEARFATASVFVARDAAFDLDIR